MTKFKGGEITNDPSEGRVWTDAPEWCFWRRPPPPAPAVLAAVVKYGERRLLGLRVDWKPLKIRIHVAYLEWPGLSGISKLSKFGCFAKTLFSKGDAGEVDGVGDVARGGGGGGSFPFFRLSDHLSCSIPRTHLDITSNHLYHARSSLDLAASVRNLGNSFMYDWLNHQISDLY